MWPTEGSQSAREASRDGDVSGHPVQAGGHAAEILRRLRRCCEQRRAAERQEWVDVLVGEIRILNAEWFCWRECCDNLVRLRQHPDSSAFVFSLDASVVAAQGPVDSHKWSTASFVRSGPSSVLQYASTVDSQCVNGQIWAPPTTGQWVHSDCVCVCFLLSVVEDDEDGFPTTRPDGEFLHNNNGSKEKRECEHIYSAWSVSTGFCSCETSAGFTLHESSRIQLQETVMGRHWPFEQCPLNLQQQSSHLSLL